MPKQIKIRVFYFDLLIKGIKVEYYDVGSTTEICARIELYHLVKNLVKNKDEIFITKSIGKGI